MASRCEARLKHARHYEKILYDADLLFTRGGADAARGLDLFDLNWGNIQTGQSWAERYAGEDDAAAGLCRDYGCSGPFLLDIRQPYRENIRWLEAALAAARRPRDVQGV